MREIATTDSSSASVPAGPGGPGGLATTTRRGQLIDAETDEQALAAWLRARAKKSESTFDRYKREGERFLTYLQRRGRTLDTATLTDVHAYEQALLAGQVTGRPRTPAAVDGVFAVLGSMMSLLSAAGYLRANVLVLREKQTAESDIRVERFMSNAELAALFDEAGTLGTSPRDERIRFTLVWFLSTGSRVSETLKAPMNSVYLAQEAGQSRWIWRIERKGRRRADVPLRNDALDALVRYRRHLGMPHYPTPDRQDGFLVWPLRGQSTAPLFRGTVSQELKVFFKRAAERLEDAGQRGHMAQATTHWLRHTSATQLLDAGASMRFVSKLLGHANQAITSSVYDHADRETWRHEINKGQSYQI